MPPWVISSNNFWSCSAERAVRLRGPQAPDLPVAHVVREREFLPHSHRWTAPWDLEYVRNGMPGYGLFVWLPEKRAEELARQEAWRREFSAALQGERSASL